MKVTVIGGKPQTVEVEKQEDGSYVSEDGTVYQLEHTSTIYTFVRKAEEVIDSVEDAVEAVEEELGAPESVTDMTAKVEGYIEEGEDVLAPGLEATEVTEEPEVTDAQTGEPITEAPEETPEA